jgi:hypothetical protein
MDQKKTDDRLMLIWRMAAAISALVIILAVELNARHIASTHVLTPSKIIEVTSIRVRSEKENEDASDYDIERTWKNEVVTLGSDGIKRTEVEYDENPTMEKEGDSLDLWVSPSNPQQLNRVGSSAARHISLGIFFLFWAGPPWIIFLMNRRAFAKPDSYERYIQSQSANFNQELDSTPTRLRPDAHQLQQRDERSK